MTLRRHARSYQSLDIENRAMVPTANCKTIWLFGIGGSIMTRSAMASLPSAARAIVAALCFFATPVSASDVDSENLFGFSLGTDIGAPSEKELELGMLGSRGKRAGSYGAVGASMELSIGIGENVRAAPGISFAYVEASNVPGVTDVRRLALAGVSLEVKRRLLDRATNPFGLTISLTPSLSRLDEADGQRTRQAAVGLRAAFDKELVADRLLAAFNIGYEPSISRDPNGASNWRAASEASVSLALAARVSERLFVGAEARYIGVFNSAVTKNLAGRALFFGPTLHFKSSENTFVAAAWGRQLAGHASQEAGKLDLANFSRDEFRLRFGYGF